VSRETEFLTRHKEDLRLAAELCRELQRQAIEVTPRQRKYLRLLAVCKRLEGSARQMAHERGDDFRWLQIGHHYHKVSEMVMRLRHEGHWLRFGALADVFEAGIAKVEKLATAANGMTSMSTSPLLLLPQFLRSKVTAGGIIIP
jgi:hypothetical protein